MKKMLLALAALFAAATTAFGAPDTPDLMRRRMDARTTIRKLRDWTRGEAVVRALAGLDDSRAESAEIRTRAESGSPAGGSGERSEPEGVSRAESAKSGDGESAPNEPPPPEEAFEDLPPDDL